MTHVRSILMVALGSTFLAAAAHAAPAKIDPEAKKQLEKMSAFLGKQKSFVVDTKGSIDTFSESGQKIEVAHTSRVTVQRPNGLHVERVGEAKGATELVYDGKTLTLYSADKKVYGQVEAPATLEETIIRAQDELDIPTPAADLLLENPGKAMMESAISGKYIGKATLDGFTTHHVAFHGQEVDFELWIQDGETPWPRKYVITTTTAKGNPSYSVEFANWKTDPMIEEDEFKFAPPKGVEKIDVLLPKGMKKTGALTPDGAKVVSAQYGTSRRVARRTSRRTSARQNAYYHGGTAGVGVAGGPYLGVLPAGCGGLVGGYYNCGGAYYRPVYQGSTVVYVEGNP